MASLVIDSMESCKDITVNVNLDGLLNVIYMVQGIVTVLIYAVRVVCGELNLSKV